MKKIFLLFTFCLFISFSFGQTQEVAKTLPYVVSNSSTVKSIAEKSLSAAHQDLRDGITELHQDVEGVYADSKNAISILYGDSKDLLKTIYPKLEAGLIALAETLKTTVKEVFEILVIKQIAIGVGYLLQLLLGISFMYLFFKVLFVSEDKLYTEVGVYGRRRWKAKYTISALFSFAFSMVFLINSVVHFQDMVIGLLAPKAGAITDLINMVNTLIK